MTCPYFYANNAIILIAVFPIVDIIIITKAY